MADKFVLLTTSSISLMDTAEKLQLLPPHKVDRVFLVKGQADGSFTIQLKSTSEMDELSIPSSLQGFSLLEKWLKSLPGFDASTYASAKDSTVRQTPFLLWERDTPFVVPDGNPDTGMRVEVTDDEITILRNNGHTERISQGDIEIIAINSYANEWADTDYYVNLYGFAKSTVGVRSRAVGFSALLRWLFALPDFDRAYFESSLERVAENPEVIWTATPVADAFIREEKPATNVDWEQMEKGILLEDRNFLLEWSDFDSLEKTKLAKRVSNSLPNPDYRQDAYLIPHPVIFGGLQVKTLEIQGNPYKLFEKPDKRFPMESASIELSLGKKGRENFDLLNRHLSEYLGMPETDEQDGQLTSTWKYGRLSITLSAWQPHGIKAYFHRCAIYLHDEPDVTRFFTDEYVSSFVLDENVHCLVIDTSLNIRANYKDNSNVRFTPKPIAEMFKGRSGCVFWLDAKQQKIGIGNKDYAYIVPLKRMREWIFVQSYWRDHPSHLALYYREKGRFLWSTKREKYIGDFESDDKSQWEVVQSTMEAFFSIPCRVTEDRQYY